MPDVFYWPGQIAVSLLELLTNSDLATIISVIFWFTLANLLIGFLVSRL